MRVLWPPLLPVANHAGRPCPDNAKQHPIPTVAIGLTFGPAVILTTSIAGPPLLVADWAVQTSYHTLSEQTLVIDDVEKGASCALQVAHLAVLCSKLVAKQGMSVCKSQIKCRGGAGKYATMLLVVLWTRPCIRSKRFWMGGSMRDVVGFVHNAVSGRELSMDTL